MATAELPEEPPKLDKPFVAMAALTAITAVYDIETTFQAMDRCAGCYESNAVLRPFVSGGRAPTYGITAALTSVSLAGSWHLRKSGNRFWWAPLAGTALLHFFAAENNRRIH